MIDAHTREALAIEADTSLPGARVDRIVAERGRPRQIVPAGILAGIMASVEASRVHDRESTAAYTRPP